MNINLFISYYEDKDLNRREDIYHVMRKNYSNKLINNIYKVDSRWYGDIFRFVNLLYGTDKDINIVANSDIFFDDTLLEFYTNKQLMTFMRNGGFLALNRWDDIHGKYHVHSVNYSQDTWIFYGKPKNGLISGKADFNLGVWASDNKIAWEIADAGYDIKNYPWLIKTYHHHPSAVRRTTKEEALPVPHKFVEPENFPLQVPETSV